MAYIYIYISSLYVYIYIYIYIYNVDAKRVLDFESYRVPRTRNSELGKLPRSEISELGTRNSVAFKQNSELGTRNSVAFKQNSELGSIGTRNLPLTLLHLESLGRRSHPWGVPIDFRFRSWSENSELGTRTTRISDPTSQISELGYLGTRNSPLTLLHLYSLGRRAHPWGVSINFRCPPFPAAFPTDRPTNR